jgi:thiol peroxidase
MSKTNLKGGQVSLAGNFIQTGVSAPDFEMIKGDLSPFKLSDSKGKYLILNVFPSLDTSVCATSVRKFNQHAASLSNTIVLAISKDLPFAQGRFCSIEGIENVVALSDFRNISDFGKKYGVLIEDSPLQGLLARAVIVLNTEGKVIYSELVPEITQEPDYQKALEALK